MTISRTLTGKLYTIHGALFHAERAYSGIFNSLYVN
jgi:hypothetical protein